MSDQPVQQVVVLQKPKTAAPMILGVIAFILALPSTICAAACAGIAAGASDSASPFLLLAPSVISFILCFFCKAKCSKATGAIILVLSILSSVVFVLFFNLLGLIANILFIVAGGLSIANAKRPNA